MEEIWEDDLTLEEKWEYYTEHFGITFPEKEFAETLYKYVPIAFLVLGTVGNLLSTLILYHLYKKVLSSCLYLFAVSIIDTLTLYVVCGNMWIKHMLDVDVRKWAMFSSNSLCKIYPFVESFLTHLSIWLIVAMVIETTIVTLKVEKLLKVFVVERARAVILLIIVLLVCVNAHCFWSFTRIKEKEKEGEPEKWICSNSNRQGSYASEEFRRLVWPIMDILIMNFFPYFIIFSCTVILITRKVRRTDHSREAVNVWVTYHLDGSSAREFHISIITLCVIYLLLMLPKFATCIFAFLVKPEGMALIHYSLQFDSKMILAKAVCDFLHFTFLSFKFLIYTFTSKKFRDELCLLVTCQRCRRNQPRPQRFSPTKNSNRYEPANSTLANNELLLPNDVHATPIRLTNRMPYSSHGNSLEKRPFAITSV